MSGTGSGDSRFGKTYLDTSPIWFSNWELLAGNVSCPTLFIHGEKDSLVPPSHSARPPGIERLGNPARFPSEIVFWGSITTRRAQFDRTATPLGQRCKPHDMRLCVPVAPLEYLPKTFPRDLSYHYDWHRIATFSWHHSPAFSLRWLSSSNAARGSY